MQEGHQSSAFIAGVILDNGVANIIHRRLREHSDKKLVTQHEPFVPVKLQEPTAQTDASNLALGADIRVELSL